MMRGSQAARDWQEQFDFLLPRAEFLKIEAVASAIGCSEQTIHEHIEAGRLVGHDISAGGGRRKHIRVRRDSVILFLAACATYAPADLSRRLIEVLGKQPKADLIQIHAAISELLRRRS